MCFQHLGSFQMLLQGDTGSSSLEKCFQGTTAGKRTENRTEWILWIIRGKYCVLCYKKYSFTFAFQEQVVMNLGSQLLVFPLYICCNFLYTSPEKKTETDGQLDNLESWVLFSWLFYFKCPCCTERKSNKMALHTVAEEMQLPPLICTFLCISERFPTQFGIFPVALKRAQGKATLENHYQFLASFRQDKNAAN